MGRLIRQLFTESLLLALVGAVAGLALSSVVFRAILIWTEAPPWLDPTPDGRVVAFALATGLGSALVFGLSPAFQIARQRLQITTSRTFLIGAQIASSVVLLVVASLLVRRFDRAVSSNPGFEYEHVVAVNPSLSEHGYAPARARAYLDELEARLRGLPGVEAVGLTSTTPLVERRSGHWWRSMGTRWTSMSIRSAPPSLTR
ncbi:MAG: hypothetical protein JJE39_14020 [Vicinamibacteria bacterium]|nr:hypothetical protein [Vicinamibacteria bacterium]